MYRVCFTHKQKIIYIYKVKNAFKTAYNNEQQSTSILENRRNITETPVGSNSIPAFNDTVKARICDMLFHTTIF